MKQRQRKVKLLMQNQLTVQDQVDSQKQCEEADLHSPGRRQEQGSRLSPVEIGLVGEEHH